MVTKLNCIKENYVYTRIYINTKELNSPSWGITAKQKKLQFSIMCQTGYGRTASRASKNDLKGIIIFINSTLIIERICYYDKNKI